jgi:hypothetical protein
VRAHLDRGCEDRRVDSIRDAHDLGNERMHRLRVGHVDLSRENAGGGDLREPRGSTSTAIAVAPAAAQARAVAAPMPDPPPVTSTTAPENHKRRLSS